MILKVCFGRRDEWYMIASQIVMAVEQTKASHSWIEIDGVVYESHYPESRRTLRKNYPYTVEKEFHFHLPDERYSDVLNFIYKLLGKKYSFFQLAIIAFGNISSLISKQISKEDYNGKHRLICTELCARVLTEFYKIDFGESFDTIGIRDLMHECKMLELAQGGYK